MIIMFQQYGLLLGSCLLGVAVAGVTRWLVHILHSSRPIPDSSFERQRREAIRVKSAVYRWFEPIIDEIAGSLFAGSSTAELARHLRFTRNDIPYQPAEFLATKAVEGTVAGLAIFACVAVTGFTGFASLLGLGVALTYPALARKSVINESDQRLKRVRLRLPFVVDQISLMMEAGAGFDDSLSTAVHDNPDHPLSRELSEVLRQMALGRPRDQALREFRDRLADDDISELVFAIVKGEELGTPLSSILREQANQMRLKRSQWGEKAAAEAEVQIVFPGMITMIACLLVIVAPILLPAVMTFLGG